MHHRGGRWPRTAGGAQHTQSVSLPPRALPPSACCPEAATPLHRVRGSPRWSSTTPAVVLCAPAPLTRSPRAPPPTGHPSMPPAVLTPRPVVDLSCEPGPGSGVVTYCSQFAARTAPPFAVRFASQVCFWCRATGRSCHTSSDAPATCCVQRHPHWLACVDEEGFVTLVDTRHRVHLPRTTNDSGRLLTSPFSAQLPDAMSDITQWAGRTQWLAHHNAVFDCCWADGDASLVTCSGDQRCRLWDVPTQACVATLRGHTGSVKTCAARPDAPWGLATGGRDGSLCLWDTRSPCRGGTPGGGHGLLPVARVLVRLLPPSAAFALSHSLSSPPPSFETPAQTSASGPPPRRWPSCLPAWLCPPARR